MSYNNDTHEGPELPPLLPGLPHTPVENLKELLLQIIVRGLIDDDVRYVEGDNFLKHAMYLGLEPLMAAKIRLAFYRGEIQQSRLEAILYGMYIRRPEIDGPVHWQSWSRVATG